MKKNKLFLILSILIILILLCTAATCNFCGITPITETASSSSIKNESDNSSEQNTKEETTVAETTQNGTTGDVSTVITAGIIDHTAKQIALTFDAGWLYENTEALLNLLDEYNVKATFFVRGLWVKDHPDLATEIVNRGHDLENHSLTHGHMNAMTDAEVEN